MTRYKFQHWEDPNLINPQRVINITGDTQITAYYEEIVMIRKGSPSQSSSVPVTVHPKAVEAEPTTLTLKSDKTECNSGDFITLNGTLTFTLDATPLDSRTIEIYENTLKIGTATTNTDGSYTYSHTAPTVTVDTTYNYQAKFAGDP